MLSKPHQGLRVLSQIRRGRSRATTSILQVLHHKGTWTTSWYPNRMHTLMPLSYLRISSCIQLKYSILLQTNKATSFPIHTIHNSNRCPNSITTTNLLIPSDKTSTSDNTLWVTMGTLSINTSSSSNHKGMGTKNGITQIEEAKKRRSTTNHSISKISMKSMDPMRTRIWTKPSKR